MLYFFSGFPVHESTQFVLLIPDLDLTDALYSYAINRFTPYSYSGNYFFTAKPPIIQHFSVYPDFLHSVFSSHDYHGMKVNGLDPFHEHFHIQSVREHTCIKVEIRILLKMG